MATKTAKTKTRKLTIADVDAFESALLHQLRTAPRQEESPEVLDRLWSELVSEVAAEDEYLAKNGHLPWARPPKWGHGQKSEVPRKAPSAPVVKTKKKKG